MRTLSWVLKYSLSRMLESAAEMINRHLRMLLYDNGVDLDLTALWRSLIRTETLIVAIFEPRSSIVCQEFSISAYPVWKQFFFQREHKNCKLFLVALVSDCFGYYSVGL